MSQSTQVALASRFMATFAGLTRAHGVYNINSSREDGKRVGSAVTKREPVTIDLWEKHLSGAQGLGIVPIRDGNDCLFGAIDVDEYPVDHKGMVGKLARNDIRAIVCRTKSGGAHIYCFADEPIPAGLMRSKLGEIASFLGYGSSEIFPKQSHILSEQGDIGQWINMPYFAGTKGMRFAVNAAGNALSAEEFLALAEKSQNPKSWFSTLIVMSREFADGPPCLQVLAQTGYPTGTRNDGLYNIGVYLKRSNPDQWEDELAAYNQRSMDPPLNTTEVQGVLKSLKRKEYQYGCTKQPIAQHCNSALCRTRKYGVGSGTTGKFPALGPLTKLDTRPPIWFWTVDGVRMELTTENLQDPRSFQRKCMEHLNIMPAVPSPAVWQAAVQHAMDSVVIVSAPVDASPEGQFWEMVEKFCTSRAQATTVEEIILGKPFSNGGRTYFRMADLIAYLNRHKFMDFRSVKIASMLRDAGADHHASNFKGRCVNYWSLPEFARQTESLSLPEEVHGKDDAF